ncbi:hypothetical protein BHE74_00031972 [Ensete ventricosum]|nr:hypothetical protein BHE74_00031972 [Ensete ventricosum]
MEVEVEGEAAASETLVYSSARCILHGYQHSHQCHRRRSNSYTRRPPRTRSPTIRRPTNQPPAITTSAMLSREAPTVNCITPGTVLSPASLASELLLVTAFSGKEETVHLEVMGMSNTWIPLLSEITFTDRRMDGEHHERATSLLSRIKMEGTGMPGMITRVKSGGS